jgi:methyltransferase (TIGR00027 family)
MPVTLIKDVSDTAFMVAMFRAIETERADALFRDPLAAIVAGEHGKKIVAGLPRVAKMSAWTVVIRTCIIDDFIRNAVAGGVDAIVNLGAGLDTRPYRMELPQSLLWVEADYPHVVALKEERLAAETPRCKLERVAVDLADGPARRAFLSAMALRATKILVLTEGVVPYLTNDEAASLGAELRSLPAFRNWVVDYFSKESIQGRKRVTGSFLQNAPFRFDPPDFFQFFGAMGWNAKEVRYIPEESLRLKRPIPLPLPMKMAIRLTRIFAPRERLDAFLKFAGYALLEPGG